MYKKFKLIVIWGGGTTFIIFANCSYVYSGVDVLVEVFRDLKIDEAKTEIGQTLRIEINLFLTIDFALIAMLLKTLYFNHTKQSDHGAMQYYIGAVS